MRRDLKTKATLSAQVIFGIAISAFFLAALGISCVFGSWWIVIVSAVGLIGSVVSTFRGISSTVKELPTNASAPPGLDSINSGMPWRHFCLGALVGGMIPFGALWVLN